MGRSALGPVLLEPILVPSPVDVSSSVDGVHVFSSLQWPCLLPMGHIMAHSMRRWVLFFSLGGLLEAVLLGTQGRALGKMVGVGGFTTMVTMVTLYDTPIVTTRRNNFSNPSTARDRTKKFRKPGNDMAAMRDTGSLHSSA